MDGMHDLGGKQGFGPVRYTLNAQAFHAPWEIRANALYGFAVRSGLFNMDEYRHAIERMEPRHYLAASYYERSLTALLTLCVEKGIVTAAALEKLAGGAVSLSSANGPGRPNATRAASASVPATGCGCAMNMCRVMCGCPAMCGARLVWWWPKPPPTPSPTRMPMACRRKKNPLMTCASAAKICGRNLPTPRWSMSACFRVISSWPE